MDLESSVEHISAKRRTTLTLAVFLFGVAGFVRTMARGLHQEAVECRLLLCKSSVSLAERKTTILKQVPVG